MDFLALMATILIVFWLALWLLPELMYATLRWWGKRVKR